MTSGDNLPPHGGPETAAPHAVYGAPAPAAAPAKRISKVKLTITEVAVFLLVINLFGMVALYIKMERDKPPVVATVAVTALARNYEQQFANDPNSTPELVKAKTNIFMASAEEAVKAYAHDQHMVILARECVLAGESKDLTSDMQSVVDAALKKNAAQAGGLGNAGDPFHVQ